jgi:hypothetical protein
MTADVSARITVSLITKAEDALDELHADLGLNKTDIVNRALQLYQFVREVERAGGHISTISADGLIERVRLI